MANKLNTNRMIGDAPHDNGVCVQPLTIEEKEELKARILLTIEQIGAYSE